MRNLIFTQFLVLILLGCSGDEKQDNFNEVFSYRSGERLLNDEQIEIIGETHNQFLATVFEDFDFEAEDIKVEFHNLFENLDPDHFQIIKADL